SIKLIIPYHIQRLHRTERHRYLLSTEKGSARMTRIKTKFGFSTTAAEVLDGVDLTGKTMIVTGGASGIGIETVRALSQAGAAVTIATRRPDAAETGAAELRESTTTIDVRELDIADLASVRRFASNWDR